MKVCMTGLTAVGEVNTFALAAMAVGFVMVLWAFYRIVKKRKR